MPLCEPVRALYVQPWDVLECNGQLALEQSSSPALPVPAYRVLIAESKYVVASSSSKKAILDDWSLCKRYADMVSGEKLADVFMAVWEDLEKQRAKSHGGSREAPNLREGRSMSSPVLSQSLPLSVLRSGRRSLNEKDEPAPHLSVAAQVPLPEEYEPRASSTKMVPLSGSKEELAARALLERDALYSVPEVPDLTSAVKSLTLPANRGTPQVARALASHPKDHWAKLQFEKGEVLLTFPDAPAGSADWLLGQTGSGEVGLFFRHGFIELLDCSLLEIEVEFVDLSKKKEKDKAEVRTDYVKGWLWKKGLWGIRKKFKKRWFVLDVAKLRLYYYVTKEDEATGNSRGFIDIAEVTTVHETFYSRSRHKKGDWPFEIHTPDREWLLKADREEQMMKWIQRLNSLASYTDHRRLIEQFTIPLPGGAQAKDGNGNQPRLLRVPSGTHALNGAAPQAVPSLPKDSSDEFATFGAPFGEEITNKHTILGDLDKFLGSREPPAVEYVFVEPYLNFARKTGRVFGRWQITLNPYGHAVVRYTLPGTKEQLVMNIVGLAGEELVNFLPPSEFFFGTNFDIKTGNEQGGLYNRNFVSVRIQRVPDERVLAMHQYFLDLANRAHKEKANYNVILGPVLNMLGGTMYGNCAYWCSKGLNQVGLVDTISMIPKAIWIDMFELLKANNQQDKLSANTTVVYYKRCLHAKRFYGADADWAGWGRTPSTRYDDLIQLADAIVEIPAGTKTAVVLPGPVRLDEKKRQRAVRMADFTPKIQLNIDVGVRILYNEYFQESLDTRSLRPAGGDGAEQEGDEDLVRFLKVGTPPWSNSWLVDKHGAVFRTQGEEDDVTSVTWLPVAAPTDAGCSCIAAGEDGNCWAVFGAKLYEYVRQEEGWKELQSPPDSAPLICLSFVTTEIVWALSEDGVLYRRCAGVGSWEVALGAPALATVSCGGDEEVWGVTDDNRAFRRIPARASHATQEEMLLSNGSLVDLTGNGQDTWVEIHGALLTSVSVASGEEVWGVDPEGQAFIWSRQTEVVHGYGKKIMGGQGFEEVAHETVSRNHRHWKGLGNFSPLSKVSVTTSGAAWGVGKASMDTLFRLSSHRLVLTTTCSTRKVWDDRKAGARPFNLGLWRPLPPDGFFAFGDLAERSQLENCSTPAVVVKEVGKRPGEIDILVAPSGYKRVWTSAGVSSRNGRCSIWRPVPPCSDYVAMGDVASMHADKPPPTDLVRCVHKDFVCFTKPYVLGEQGCLWSTRSSTATSPCSVWLVEPALTGILCNTFITSPNLEAPDRPVGCLKIAA